MRLVSAITGLLVLLALPAASYAIGFELAVGAWNQDPSGTLSYQAISGQDELDIEKDNGYSDEWQMTGRAKVDMPLIIPNVYLMATPMEFDGTGQKNVSFTFGGQTFNANVPYDSKVTLDHYDLALYYGLPFLSTATMGKLNAEVGLDIRFIDFSASVSQPTLGQSASKDLSLVLPMVYLGAQVSPVDMLSVEAEARGIAISGNHYYDFIGRLKFKPVPFVFIAGGYRLEDVKIDEEDALAEVDFSGPFIEAGVEF